MPVAIEMRFTGATIDQYNQVIEKMGLEPGGDTPPGALFHWVAETDNGLQIVDVWETREAYDKFAAEQIGPFSAEVGIAPPDTTYYEIYNHFAAQ